jgi:hypothetical protein
MIMVNPPEKRAMKNQLPMAPENRKAMGSFVLPMA